MKRYPLQLKAIAKTAPWGGTKLVEQWGKTGNDGRMAEAWELSVRERDRSVIVNGDAAGWTLQAYLEVCGGDCVAPGYRTTDRFPLLVKFIDAADRLSVQVHPDDAYAARVERDSGKTELWYIVEAEQGSSIVYGLQEGVSCADVRAAAEQKRLPAVMRTCSVRAGESYWIPSGMVHALGKGILLAEIQQNSDLTYRLDDYGRRQADGSLRELHTEKAMAVLRPFTAAEVDADRFSKGKGDASLLAHSRYFTVRKREIASRDGAVWDRQGEESFLSLLCVGGEGCLLHAGVSYPLVRGDSYFLPAGIGEYALLGDLTLLCTTL